MRNDVKIKRVISKYGLEGYGLYNLIVESITETLSTESPMPDLQETCEDIADFYNGNTAKVNEMANYMINQGLFDIDEMSGAILCHKVYKFLDTSQTRSEQLRTMIKAYKDGQKSLVSQTVSDGPRSVVTNMKEKKRKETEVEQEENTIDTPPATPEKKDSIPYQKIVDILNASCNTNYRSTTGKTRTLIKARYNEGFTLTDFEAVITKKKAGWTGTEWEKYLRPETLFSPKFESYLNEKDGAKKREPPRQKTAEEYTEGF